MPELSPAEQENRRGPTDTLIHVLEEFGQSEPLDCCVVWINQSGDFCWSQAMRSRAILIGMLDMVRELTIHDMVRERNEPSDSNT